MVPRLWLNLNEEIGFILGRARPHCFPTGGRRKNPGQSVSPQFESQLCFRCSVQRKTLACTSQPQSSHRSKGVNSACWGKRRLRPGWRMIVVTKVEKGQRVKDRKLLSYGREKKGAHIPRKKSHQGPLLGQGEEVVNSSLFPLWWVWKSQDFFKCKLQKPILKCLKKKKTNKTKNGEKVFFGSCDEEHRRHLHNRRVGLILWPLGFSPPWFCFQGCLQRQVTSLHL